MILSKNEMVVTPSSAQWLDETLSCGLDSGAAEETFMGFVFFLSLRQAFTTVKYFNNLALVAIVSKILRTRYPPAKRN